MSRPLYLFALLLSASLAAAAPPKASPRKTKPAEATTPVESIDLDAMARAKDVDASTPASDANAQSADAASAQDQAAPKDESGHAAPAEEASPAQAPEDATQPEAAAAPEAESAPSAAENAESAPADTGASASKTEPAAASESPSAASDSASTTEPAAAATPTPEDIDKRVAAGCRARATSLLDAAQKADFDGATRDFDAKMKSALPASKFKEAWTSLDRFGKLNARGQSHVSRGDGYTIVMIPLIFDKTDLVAQIACGSDGLIAGFHVVPLPKPQS